MRVFAMSDIHTEFQRDQGQSFMTSLPLQDIDVLVVAGDLTNAAGLEDSVALLCDSAPEVCLVLGNHEFYFSSIKAVTKTMEKLVKKHSNLHWLDESVAVIQGKRFVGTTLWFPDAPNSFRHRSGMNDFQVIQGLTPWVFEKNSKAVKFLQANVQPGDFVVTHHLPSYQCVVPEYQGSPLNAFFVSEMEPFLSQCRAKYWLFGHTHSSVNFVVGNPQLGETTVLSNPFGYRGENRDFKNLVLDF